MRSNSEISLDGPVAQHAADRTAVFLEQRGVSVPNAAAVASRLPCILNAEDDQTVRGVCASINEAVLLSCRDVVAEAQLSLELLEPGAKLSPIMAEAYVLQAFLQRYGSQARFAVIPRTISPTGIGGVVYDADYQQERTCKADFFGQLGKELLVRLVDHIQVNQQTLSPGGTVCTPDDADNLYAVVQVGVAHLPTTGADLPVVQLMVNGDTNKTKEPWWVLASALADYTIYAGRLAA